MYHAARVDLGRHTLLDGVELGAEELLGLLPVVGAGVGADELPVAANFVQNVKLPSAFSLLWIVAILKLPSGAISPAWLIDCASIVMFDRFKQWLQRARRTG
jgi:hypothetical protein